MMKVLPFKSALVSASPRCLAVVMAEGASLAELYSKVISSKSRPGLSCAMVAIFSRSASVMDRVALFLRPLRNCVSCAFVAGSGGGALRLSRLRVKKLLAVALVLSWFWECEARAQARPMYCYGQYALCPIQPS